MPGSSLRSSIHWLMPQPTLRISKKNEVKDTPSSSVIYKPCGYSLYVDLLIFLSPLVALVVLFPIYSHNEIIM